MSFEKILAGWRASARHGATFARCDPVWHCAREEPEPGYGVYWAMEVAAEPRTAPQVAVWFVPFPVLVIQRR